MRAVKQLDLLWTEYERLLARADWHARRGHTVRADFMREQADKLANRLLNLHSRVS